MNRSLKRIAVLAAFLGAAVRAGAQDVQLSKPPLRPPAPGEGQELVGRQAPDWGRLTWIDSKERPRLKDLKGRLVLVRWWTDGCVFCVDSTAVLNRLAQKYSQQGLVVIGMYHPRLAGKVPVDNVKAASQLLDFRFPVAVDDKWKALKPYWLKGADRATTMASFLIDGGGVIRWVHPGPGYTPEQAQELDRLIQRFLSLPGAAPAKP